MSHPPIPYRFGIVTIDFGILNGLALAFANGFTMKILFTISKTNPNLFDMATEADGTPTLDSLADFFAADFT